MNRQTLECADIVFRALIRATHIDRISRQVLAAAFLLRPNEQGLSVSFDCTPADCAAEFNRCYGVATLHVGRVRALGLDIIPDEPNHANITGLPYQDDNPAEAERLARQLQAQARLVSE